VSPPVNLNTVTGHLGYKHWPWRQEGSHVVCTCGQTLYVGRMPKSKVAANDAAAFMDRTAASARERGLV
jgi:hypothetical protein